MSDYQERCTCCGKFGWGHKARPIKSSYFEWTGRTYPFDEHQRVFKCNDCLSKEDFDVVNAGDFREVFDSIILLKNELLKKYPVCLSCGKALKLHERCTIERIDFKKGFEIDNAFMYCDDENCFIKAQEAVIPMLCRVDEIVEATMEMTIKAALLNNLRDFYLSGDKRYLTLFHNSANEESEPRFGDSVECGNGWYFSPSYDGNNGRRRYKKTLIYKLDLDMLVADFIRYYEKEKVGELMWHPTYVSHQINRAVDEACGVLFDAGRSKHMIDVGGQVVFRQGYNNLKFLQLIKTQDYVNNEKK